MKPLAVYVHIPFCTVKCGYCDFNAYAGLDSLKPRYLKALRLEIETWASVLRGREVASIGFGGGTPGESPASQIAAVIGRIAQFGTLQFGAEISLEANPGTTNLAYLKALRDAGVNRISFGAQSFDADELRFLDRIHSPEATAASLGLARKAGIPSVGLDLIYGLPGQPMKSWQRSLAAAIALDPDHISTYALTVEDGTPLAARIRRGLVEPIDPDVAADMYELATERLTEAAYEQYELSNWCRPGHESRHNRVYWTDGDYLGIGAGAHGYLDGERYENIAHPYGYSQALLGGSKPVRPAVANAYRPSEATAMSDWMMLALRLTSGFEELAFERKFGRPLYGVAGPPLVDCEAAGLLERSEGSLRLTRRGRLFHGEVAVRLLAWLNAQEPEVALPGLTEAADSPNASRPA